MSTGADLNNPDEGGEDPVPEGQVRASSIASIAAEGSCIPRELTSSPRSPRSQHQLTFDRLTGPPGSQSAAGSSPEDSSAEPSEPIIDSRRRPDMDGFAKTLGAEPGVVKSNHSEEADEEPVDPKKTDKNTTRLSEEGSTAIAPVAAPDAKPGLRVVPGSRQAPIRRLPTPDRELTPDGPDDFELRRAERGRATYQTIAQELDFREYRALVAESPRLHLRNAAGYIADAIAYWDGGDPQTVTQLGRTFRRFKALDRPWEPDEIQKTELLFGHDWTLFQVWEKATILSKSAVPDSGLLLHGPPGSGKTLLSDDTINGAIAAYSSRAPEGATYGLVWELDPNMVGGEKGTMGFGGGDSKSDGKIRIYTHTNPIFLLSREPDSNGGPSDRQDFLKHTLGYDPKDRNADFNVDYFLKGDLDPTSRDIFKILLAHYEGDVSQVWKHAKAVRFTMDKRDSSGIVHKGPTSSPNTGAASAPVQAHSSLPDEMSNGPVNIRFVKGDAVAGHRGRFNLVDALKGQSPASLSWLLPILEGRPIEVTSNGEHLHFYCDQLSTLEANDTLCAPFFSAKQPGSDALRSRLEVVTVPMIRVASAEEAVYRQELTGPEAAPHALRALSMFVVGTRTLKPNAERYDERHHDEIDKELIQDLSIVEKLLLMDDVPDRELNLLRDKSKRLDARQIARLRKLAPDVADEYMKGVGEISFAGYDGAQGIDTRKAVKGLLRHLLEKAGKNPLTVMDVVKGLEEMLSAGNMHDRLVRQEKQRLTELLWQKDNSNKEFSKATDDELVELNKQVDEHFLFCTGDELLEQVKKISQSLIMRDFEEASGMVKIEDVVLAVQKYLYHVTAYVAGKAEGMSRTVEIPEHFRERIHEGGPSEVIMRNFEDRFVNAELEAAKPIDRRGDRVLATAVAHSAGADSESSHGRSMTKEERNRYRQKVMGTLSTFAHGNPGERPIDFAERLFSELIESVYEEYSKQIKEMFVVYQRILEETGGGDAPLKTDVKHLRFYDRVNAGMVERGYQKDKIINYFFFAKGDSK